MKDHLDFLIDSRLVRETDLRLFATEPAVQAWRKRVIKIYRVLHVEDDDDDLFNMLDQLDMLISPRRDQLREAAEARKLTLGPRNLDLIVIPQAVEERVSTMNYGMTKQTAGEVRHLLECFDRAEQMTAYEFDAYDTLGEEECERQRIETLHDMFGTDFAEAFYRRKHALIAIARLNELQSELHRIQHEITQQEKIIEVYKSQK